MISQNMRRRLEEISNELIHPITINYSSNNKEDELKTFLETLTTIMPMIQLNQIEEGLEASFTIKSAIFDAKIHYACLPIAEEFEAFVDLLQQLGSGNIPLDASDQQAIAQLNEAMHFTTYMNLSCNKCSSIVRAFNLFALLNPRISHTIFDVNLHQELVEDLNIFALPTVYLNDAEYFVGRLTTQEILYRLYGQLAKKAADQTTDTIFDTLIIGGGPAGIAASIYSARKGIRTGLVYDELGGRVNDITGLENFIGQDKIDGPELVQQFTKQLEQYDIVHYKDTLATKIAHGYDFVTVSLSSGITLRAKTLIITTGAERRLMGIPGEEAFHNHGISYCVHCDGPLYRDKEVIVVGGGNQGVQAALALTDIARKIIVLEWRDSLSADTILCQRIHAYENIEVRYHSFITAILGDDHVTSVQYMDHHTGNINTLDTEGVFIMTGFNPNTAWLDGVVELNRLGEIKVDQYGQTNRANIFAAGDCTQHRYKQVSVSIGSGAVASMAAYDFIKLSQQ